MKEESYIPLIDISSLIKFGIEAPEAEKTIAEIQMACRNVGFFSIKNHGVSKQEISTIVKRAKEFFHLPLEVKNKIAGKKWVKENKNSYRGYFPGSSNGEGREGLDIHDLQMVEVPEKYQSSSLYEAGVYPEMPEEWMDDVKRYFETLDNLSRLISRAMFKALGKLPEWMEFQKNNFKRPHCLSTLRFNYYPDKTKPTKDSGEIKLSLGSHTDNTFLTVLYQDCAGGLQVKNFKSQEWHTVPYDDQVFVINTGETLQHLSNGVYPATYHRVLLNYHERISVPFFLEPQGDAMLDAKIFNEQSERQPMTYEQHLKNRLVKYQEYQRSQNKKVYE